MLGWAEECPSGQIPDEERTLRHLTPCDRAWPQIAPPFSARVGGRGRAGGVLSSAYDGGNLGHGGEARRNAAVK